MIKVLAALTGVVGATLLALNIGYNYQAYVIFETSSILWMIVGYRQEDKPLLYMNTIFTVINTIGLFRY